MKLIDVMVTMLERVLLALFNGSRIGGSSFDGAVGSVMVFAINVELSKKVLNLSELSLLACFLAQLPLLLLMLLLAARGLSGWMGVIFSLISFFFHSFLLPPNFFVIIGVSDSTNEHVPKANFLVHRGGWVTAGFIIRLSGDAAAGAAVSALSLSGGPATASRRHRRKIKAIIFLVRLVRPVRHRSSATQRTPRSSGRSMLQKGLT
jgi:hypothetical protein